LRQAVFHNGFAVQNRERGGMTVDIISAGRENLDELVPLFNAYRLFFNPEADLGTSRTFLESRFRDGDVVIFLARVGDDPAGFIQLYPLWSSWHCRRIWFLSDLYVTEKYRNAGVGKMLVEGVKQFAYETGASSVMVELPHSEPHLTKFYDRLGFHHDAVFDLARYHPPR
jgi:GNAT superfamily N-acetyltransferase